MLIVSFFLDSQDLPNAMNAAEITDKLGLHSLRQRTWYIQATCATSGDGLYEGLEWVSCSRLSEHRWRIVTDKHHLFGLACTFTAQHEPQAKDLKQLKNKKTPFPSPASSPFLDSQPNVFGSLSPPTLVMQRVLGTSPTARERSPPPRFSFLPFFPALCLSLFSLPPWAGVKASFFLEHRLS